MAQVVIMPKLGFDMAEGTLVRWVIQEDEKVSKGTVLAEIETDKATVEVQSDYEGVLLRQLVRPGAVVPVNTPIAVIGAPGESVDIQQLTGITPVPEMVKAQPEREEPETRVIQKESTQPVAAEAAPAMPTLGLEIAPPGGVRASPIARRLADEHGIDLRALKGSGPGGRIVKRDVEMYLQTAPTPVLAPTPQPMPEMAIAAAAITPREDQLVPLNRLRAIIGRRMTESKQQVPHFYVTHEYDMAALMGLREEVNLLLAEGEKISVNDYLIKAAALALREVPNLNASLKGDQVLRHGAIHIGVAVAVEGGLLTVVCKHADQKSIRQISLEMRAMTARAREGKVRSEDIEGSTFSLSNMGMFDVEHFIAIINPPEAAILAVGSVRQVPVVQAGQIVPGMRMKATLSVDHRVSDGVEAARFLQVLAKYLEEPLRLLV